ncbi:hypothetical protein AXG93_496s1240 [Marchantia polymorpha subsp. ruderalis]|uniref:Prolamin-like domain-containing protein n=1 Tax=Marchantia polymorpha subsp. ruderalis TaxID=1480154 RepID=A0A176VPK5_MARPO|nr:hypothetical protein AXG93_496s1240 [Marchantia polymorpha subsp. ruderalis]
MPNAPTLSGHSFHLLLLLLGDPTPFGSCALADDAIGEARRGGAGLGGAFEEGAEAFPRLPPPCQQIGLLGRCCANRLVSLSDAHRTRGEKSAAAGGKCSWEFTSRSGDGGGGAAAVGGRQRERESERWMGLGVGGEENSHSRASEGGEGILESFNSRCYGRDLES